MEPTVAQFEADGKDLLQPNDRAGERIGYLRQRKRVGHGRGEDAMTQDQFNDAVMEQLFLRGFVCPACATVAVFAGTEWQRHGQSAEPEAVIDDMGHVPGLIKQAMLLGKPASQSGARDEWIAVHEAGHAIIVLKAGLRLWGVRYYGDGFPGETSFEETGWQTSTDETLLHSLVRISVAANVAEMMHGHEPEGGIPSQFFDESDPAEGCPCPSDVKTAWELANDLAIIRFEKQGIEPTILGLRAPKRLIIEQAEAEAGEILQANADALSRLAGELRRGPMTGAAVRAIVGG
jgi:hypothetical protein